MLGVHTTAEELKKLQKFSKTNQKKRSKTI